MVRYSRTWKNDTRPKESDGEKLPDRTLIKERDGGNYTLLDTYKEERWWETTKNQTLSKEWDSELPTVAHLQKKGTVGNYQYSDT